MSLGFQPIHLIVVFIVALIVFGPQRLPEIGRGVGRAIIEFRRGAQELTDGFRDEINTAVTPQPPNHAVANAAGNFCISCGAPNPLDARFCNQCGTQLPSREPVQPTGQSPAA